MSKRLTIVQRSGSLGQCLGVKQNISDLIDAHVAQMMLESKSMMEIIESVDTHFKLSINEWSAFMFSMGFWQAQIQAQKQNSHGK
jgi:hypothetical protein